MDHNEYNESQIREAITNSGMMARLQAQLNTKLLSSDTYTLIDLCEEALADHTYKTNPMAEILAIEQHIASSTTAEEYFINFSRIVIEETKAQEKFQKKTARILATAHDNIVIEYNREFNRFIEAVNFGIKYYGLSIPLLVNNTAISKEQKTPEAFRALTLYAQTLNTHQRAENFVAQLAQVNIPQLVSFQSSVFDWLLNEVNNNINQRLQQFGLPLVDTLSPESISIEHKTPSHVDRLIAIQKQLASADSVRSFEPIYVHLRDVDRLIAERVAVAPIDARVNTHFELPGVEKRERGHTEEPEVSDDGRPNAGASKRRKK